MRALGTLAKALYVCFHVAMISSDKSRRQSGSSAPPHVKCCSSWLTVNSHLDLSGSDGVDASEVAAALVDCPGLKVTLKASM